MYFAGFTLDNLSLMALTVATGFVVDDAIVVLENITRHVEAGMGRFEAALLGAREVGFTVLSMTLSLTAVFLPITLMGGIVGKFFNEFAIVLSASVLISLVVSLTATPMMCANLDLHKPDRKQGWLLRGAERGFDAMLRFYDKTLTFALRWPLLIMGVLVLTIGLNGVLYWVIPKGFFPSEDTGDVNGNIRADQSISFQLMQKKFAAFVSIIAQDPAVENVVGFAGGGGGGPRGGATNTGNVFVQLKPKSQRGGLSTEQVVSRLEKGRLTSISGVQPGLRNAGGVPGAGGRQSAGSYQYSLQADTLAELNEWVPKITGALQDVPEAGQRPVRPPGQGVGGRAHHRPQHGGKARHQLLADRQHALRRLRPAPGVDDLQRSEPVPRRHGRGAGVLAEPRDAQRHLCVDLRRRRQRHRGLRRGSRHDDAHARGQRHGAGRSQCRRRRRGRVAQPAAQFAHQQRARQRLHRRIGQHGGGDHGAPLSAFSSFGPGSTPLAINHDGPFVATTFSFNLPEGVSLGQATAAIDRTMTALHVPVSVHGGFAGSARIFQQSVSASRS